MQNLHRWFDGYLLSVKSTVKILQFFEAFLKNINFNFDKSELNRSCGIVGFFIFLFKFILAVVVVIKSSDYHCDKFHECNMYIRWKCEYSCEVRRKHNSHYVFTRLNPKRKSPFQFSLSALLQIHMNPKQKYLLKSSKGFLGAVLQDVS